MNETLDQLEEGDNKEENHDDKEDGVIISDDDDDDDDSSSYYLPRQPTTTCDRDGDDDTIPACFRIQPIHARVRTTSSPGKRERRRERNSPEGESLFSLVNQAGSCSDNVDHCEFNRSVTDDLRRRTSTLTRIPWFASRGDSDYSRSSARPAEKPHPGSEDSGFPLKSCKRRSFSANPWQATTTKTPLVPISSLVHGSAPRASSSEEVIRFRHWVERRCRYDADLRGVTIGPYRRSYSTEAKVGFLQERRRNGPNASLPLGGDRQIQVGRHRGTVERSEREEKDSAMMLSSNGRWIHGHRTWVERDREMERHDGEGGREVRLVHRKASGRWSESSRLERSPSSRRRSKIQLHHSVPRSGYGTWIWVPHPVRGDPQRTLCCLVHPVFSDFETSSPCHRLDFKDTEEEVEDSKRRTSKYTCCHSFVHRSTHGGQDRRCHRRQRIDTSLESLCGSFEVEGPGNVWKPLEEVTTHNNLGPGYRMLGIL